MQSYARAVVIGGGVVGVSTLYHLARKGWTDSVLIERKELASGSTWHAAGLLPPFSLSPSIAQLHRYSLRCYRALEEETGLNPGFSGVTDIRLARTRDRLDEHRAYAGMAETMGVPVRILTPAELKEVWPLCETDGILGALQHPEGGHIQPVALTQALAKGACDRGATIHRDTRVLAIERAASGAWTVVTDKGEITAGHVVSATGSFARRTGRMVGLDVPVIPIEHQYIVTEPHPALLERRRRGLPEMGVLHESDSAWSLREDEGGLILAAYERGAPCCDLDGPADDSAYELFAGELDRLMPHLETAIARVPILGEVGIRAIRNGAVPYTPDGAPIVGPAPGLDNFWLNEGHSFGIAAAGGAGWQLAEWMVEGEPTVDLAAVDPRRFGPYASEGYVTARNEEAYANVCTIRYPDAERLAARPLKVSPSYERQKALGGVFGSVYGWERANWFAPAGEEIPSADHAGRIRERWSFRRSNAFDHVGAEVRHVSEAVGLLDLTPLAKAVVTGPGARGWLDAILANRLPSTGRIALCHLLTGTGGVRAEFTVHERVPGEFLLVSAAAFERIDHDTLRRLLPKDGSVVLRTATEARGILVLAGPRSREVLARLTRTDLSDAAFPWLTGQAISLGPVAVDAWRVTAVGELGWELHHPIGMQERLYDLLMDAGAAFGIRPFGIRAMNAMALEKSCGQRPRERSTECNALEAGLGRFVQPEKGNFIGRDAILRAVRDGLRWRFATLEVQGITDADARGSEPVRKDGVPVGRTTDGGFGWRVGKSLALAMLRRDLAVAGTEVEILILGTPHRAVVLAGSPFDPENLRPRS